MENDTHAKGIGKDDRDDRDGKGKDRDDDVKVKFKHLGEHETATFEVDDDRTLQQIWDRAYRELRIERTDRDVLQAKAEPNPVSLMEHLSLTLQAARRRNLCDRQFEIAASTGGA